MVKIIMHGYLGKMGRAICEMNTKELEIVAGIDGLPAVSAMPFPTYINIQDCDMPADAIVDFSTATAVPGLIDYAVKKKIPLVICTTGLLSETVQKIEESSKKIPIFRSANMSLGINLIAALLKKVTPILTDSGFNIEIIEKHHNQKIDAPSGTALLLADAMNQASNGRFDYIYDRSSSRRKRERHELGIHSIRAGSIIGEHTVIFAGQDEALEWKHTAQSKELFAMGAVKAANFLKGKPPGIYDMQNLVESII